MKLATKTALCSIPFVVGSAFAQNTTQIQVKPGFGNPLFDLTAMYADTPHGNGDKAYYVTGHPENYIELQYYGVPEGTIVSEPWDQNYPMPILTLHGESRQCVAAVKLLSYAKQTSKWRAFEKVAPSGMQTSVPFVMATFTIGNSLSSFRYGNNSGSHVGIAFAQDSQGVWILDQNWGGTGDNPIGRLTIRHMKYSSTGVMNNPTNYYVVHQVD